MHRLELLVQISQFKYAVLSDYLEGALERQLALCERIIQEAADKFKAHFWSEWRTIDEFYNNYLRHDKIRHKLRMNYWDAKKLKKACEELSKFVGAKLRGTAKIKALQEKTIRPWLEYQSLCDRWTRLTDLVEPSSNTVGN